MDGITALNTFLAVHRSQLVMSGVPERFWPILCKKLRDQIFDSGSTFQLAQIDYEDDEQMPYDPLWAVIALKNIDRNDPEQIYLVDHAWTFKANAIKNNLRNVPGLLERMCSMMQVSGNSVEELIEGVAKNVWKFAQTYAIGDMNSSVEERTPVWYVLDELGSGIMHSNEPNFRTVPFYHTPSQMAYTLLFPIENLEAGDTITRNYVEGQDLEPCQREAMLIPWRQYNHFYEDFTTTEPDKNYFIEGHIVETLPDLELLHNTQKPQQTKLKVYAEYEYINEYLRCPDFEIVDNEQDADILWYINHFRTFNELSTNSPNKFVNQFPFEFVVTIKDLLTIIARRCNDKSFTDGNKFETSPAWWPTTFNMKTELPQLVAYYMQRKQAGLDNHWICKPYNLARGLDTYITDNLNFLCVLPQSGPKIAQKYLENPVLFERPDIGLVKFDIRYVILLKSVNPTEVYIYNNFFLRFANKPFALNNFEDYEQHFTVMNYTEANLYRMLCAEFKEAWSKQYADFSWSVVEKSVFKMFADLFTAATSKDAPCGIAKSPQSRALYAADIMLSWDKKGNDTVIQPKLLEVNWMPDCKRACEYYNDFYNDIFSLLFLDKEVESCTKVL